MIENVHDRILIVENDPVVADLISRQALQAAGYQTHIVSDGTTAINRALQLGPDAIIANLDLPGLSGKDLLVALTSQGVDVPVIVLARKGQEAELVQAFRLGAADYMLWPLREPEVINVVERVLRSGRERKERDLLSRQLQHSNQELQQRVRELTTIFAIGKAVTSITDQSLLFDRILEGATRVTQAELGWFLMRQSENQPFLLVAQRGLPPALAEEIHQPWDDGISSLVALSGESLSIHGEPVRRFKIGGLGQAALFVPVKVQKSVIGLLVTMRKLPNPFTTSEQHLLEAVADYASISLVNVRLFRTVEERARNLESMAESAQMGERVNREILFKVKNELRPSFVAALQAQEKLAQDPTAHLNTDQRRSMTLLRDQLQSIGQVIEAINPPEVDGTDANGLMNLPDLVQSAGRRFAPVAQQNGLTLTCEVPKETVTAFGNTAQMGHVLDALLSNAVKYTTAGGRVMLRLEQGADSQPHIMVSDNGAGLDAEQITNLFKPDYTPSQKSRPIHFGGLGLGLALVKEIITRHKGRIWVESPMGIGTTFHFTLPPAG